MSDEGDGDDEADPFEGFTQGSGGPPEADPFEEFGERADDAPDGSSFEERPGPSDRDDDPFADLGVGREESSGPDDPPAGGVDPADDPFADLGEASGDLDDSVWEDLSVEPETEQVEERGGRRISEVSKHSFCEQCPHFTGPPRVECTHEGTDILEFVDMETVRVADCPIVAERERLRRTNQ